MKKNSSFDKLKFLYRMSDMIEYLTENDKYVFVFKGHNLKEEDIVPFIDKEFFDEGENLKVKRVIDKIERYYYCTRYHDGNDARDEGHSNWVFEVEEYKKGYGKCTAFTVDIERYEDV